MANLKTLIEEATDKNQISEDYQKIAKVCMAVNDGGEDAAWKAVDLLINQLQDSTNGNVRLYSLTVLNAVVQNAGLAAVYNRPDKNWAALTALGTSPATHKAVKDRLIDILDDWRQRDDDKSFLEGPTTALSKMRAQKPAKSSAKPAAQANDDDDEDLKRALALSLQDQGPRSQSQPQPQPQSQPQLQPQSQGQSQEPEISQVKALYDLNASGPGELSFKAGDIIQVVDRMHKDWWKGTLRGETGIFPLNYVEPIKPAPQSVSSAASPADMEAYIFAQAKNVERLLSIFATASRHPDWSVAANPDVQRMYHELMSLHPRITQLIGEYSTKKEDLMQLNDKLLATRQSYRKMLESEIAQRNSHPVYQGYQTPYSQDQANYSHYAPPQSAQSQQPQQPQLASQLSGHSVHSAVPSQPSGLPSQPSGLPSQPSGLPSQPSGLPSQPSGLHSQPSGQSVNGYAQYDPSRAYSQMSFPGTQPYPSQAPQPQNYQAYQPQTPTQGYQPTQPQPSQPPQPSQTPQPAQTPQPTQGYQPQPLSTQAQPGQAQPGQTYQYWQPPAAPSAPSMPYQAQAPAQAQATPGYAYQNQQPQGYAQEGYAQAPYYSTS